MTDTVGGLYLKDWHPDISYAGQWVSDTTFNGMKSRGFYWNSENILAWVSFDKVYDTLLQVPAKYDFRYLYAPYDTTPAVIKFEFMHDDSTQTAINSISLSPGAGFTKYGTDVFVSSGPVEFNKVRITMSYDFTAGKPIKLLLANLRAIYGAWDTLLVEDFVAPPQFISSSVSVDFDTVVVGSSKTKTVSIKNTGEWILKFDSVTISNPLFTKGIFPSQIGAGDSATLQLFYSPTTAESAQGYLVFVHDADSSPDTITLSGIGYLPDSSQAVITGLGEGWQLTSRPFVRFADGSFKPSPVYSYGSSYIIEDTMTVGPGYWHKYQGAGQITYVGYDSVTEVTVTLHPKWNIVGAPGENVAVTDVTSEPPTLTFSQFFGYDSETGYYEADTLKPGRAYWVKASEAGTLTVSATPSVYPKTRARIVPTDEAPPPPPTGGSSTLTPTGFPTEIRLEQNYPNPFNPSTRISYFIPRQSNVRMVIYNLMGQEVKVLVNEVRSAGSYEVEFNASQLPSGVYIYRLIAGELISTNKMVLIK